MARQTLEKALMKWMVKRNQLTWPTVNFVPTS